MSQLTRLASRIDRELSGFPIAATIAVVDATGTASLTSVGSAPPRSRPLRARLSRVMAGAHPGAVVVVTLTATGETFTLTAPGGAFDGRVATPDPAILDGITSPSADARQLVIGTRLTAPTRGIQIGAAGNLQVRMMGTPDAFQPAFAVVAGALLPLRVLEIGPDTTAAPVIGLF